MPPPNSVPCGGNGFFSGGAVCGCPQVKGDTAPHRLLEIRSPVMPGSALIEIFFNIRPASDVDSARKRAQSSETMVNWR